MLKFNLYWLQLPQTEAVSVELQELPLQIAMCPIFRVVTIKSMISLMEMMYIRETGLVTTTSMLLFVETHLMVLLDIRITHQIHLETQ